MTVVDLITVISFMITIFSAGVAVGKFLSDHSKTTAVSPYKDYDDRF